MCRVRSQALVEFALVMPVLVGIVAVLFQMGFLFVAYVSLLHATRDVGRWLAVHPDTTDAQFQSYIVGDMPSTISAAQLTARALPACPTLTSGRCSARPAGSTLHVQMVYDVRPTIFLPTTFSLGFLQVEVPLALPASDYYVMVEQR
jgi:hypothetical protein